ncbi:hypothetical protein CENSYa_0334 [Cenarchaeum symbiosum A]|uniref:Uncharacterized protein n=1 Tax=Cenarchaeum symbiosum (strain A) TaxID=414004 RepID=A0RUF3_CENSY|nr:hypothetical protein CENSYa_0334 [Cenarchaeum symbiosum A]
MPPLRTARHEGPAPYRFRDQAPHTPAPEGSACIGGGRMIGHHTPACPQPLGRVLEVGKMPMAFNHDFYDSMISSGMINFLEPQLQQSIQNLFRIIKSHNNYLSITTRARYCLLIVSKNSPL